ncbi:MAG: thioredoxin [Chitinophagaceae bacterium]
MKLRTLVLSLCLLNIFLNSCAQKKGDDKIVALSAKEFKSKLETTSNRQLIDVRTPKEVNEGYISGAENIDFNEDDFEKKALQLDKQKPTFVYCKAGGRSQSAAALLISLGFKNVYDLKGGIISWNNNHLPLEDAKTKAIKLAEEKVVTDQLTVEAYNKIVSADKAVIVDFYAEWCGPCKKLSPILEAFKNEYGNKIKVVKIDFDKNPSLVRYFQIETIPLLHLYKNGKLVNQLIGMQDKIELKKEVEKLIQ